MNSELVQSEVTMIAPPSASATASLLLRLETRTARVAVLGLGYAGLPMALDLARAGFDVIGLDVDPTRVSAVKRGLSPVDDVSNEEIAAIVAAERLRVSTRFELLDGVDCVLICVPTPLTAEQQPDVSFVVAAARSIAAHLHPGSLVILQSTCPPGTTRQVLLPILEGTAALTVGHDFFLAFAPERIDPGNQRFTVRNTPKLIGGMTPACSQLASHLFAPFIEERVIVSSPEIAEMAKLVENTFRFINISFVNEMAILCDRLGLNVWEIIDAAATKPFAFLPHYPGPGVGGHCIPVVPHFLEAAARQSGVTGTLIPAAAQINAAMPGFVLGKLERLLGERGTSLAEAKVLLLGVAYKGNVGDCRESPALRVYELLRERAGQVTYFDPYVPKATVGETAIASLTDGEVLAESFDAAVLLTPHTNVDYARVGRQVGFILDTRNFLPHLDEVTVIRL